MERENYQRENNSAIGFVEECCRLEAHVSITVSKLYFGYIKHCRGSGLYPFSKPKLGKELKRLFKIGQTFGDNHGNRARVWVGFE